MSKSKNSHILQPAFGDDLLYEKELFGNSGNVALFETKIKKIEERRIQRQIKEHFKRSQ